tara:strand:+ start:257 stop:709 length:453 start_codon:yes stop_codon:yes gene_type:complete
MSWIPHITVASVIEKDKKYLFVEEYVKDLKVLNQPAGHLEENETIEEACARETLEETAFKVKVDYLIGIYQEREKDEIDMWLRFCFKCSIIEEFNERALDKNIIRKIWLEKKDILNPDINLRSSMVLKCINDYEKGIKFPKELISSFLEK